MQGVGLIYTLESLVERGLVETVPEPFWPRKPGFFLRGPSRAQVLPKLRAFIEHLRASAAREAHEATPDNIDVRR